jgi:ABC-2 type transport system ATP-binding protein
MRSGFGACRFISGQEVKMETKSGSTTATEIGPFGMKVPNFKEALYPNEGLKTVGIRRIVLETKDLTRRFGSCRAVDRLNISVNASEIFGLLGSNGAGKTTTIKMLTTLLPPTSGTATVAGFTITRQAVSVRQVIGYVPQAISVDGALTGYENLLIFAKLYDLPHRDRRARILEALAFMGLSGVASRLVREYSGGMIRRLEIAQSTLHRPPVVFLDEPTIGLDPIARNAVWEHLAQLRDNYGTTIFFTTHYMEEAENHCDRLAIMHTGKLVALGTSAQLKGSIGGANPTLDDVFAYYAGTTLEAGGNYRDASAERAVARRLG